MNPDEQPFKTQEMILAYCLARAGCELADNRTPCTNLFDEEILRKLGYRGKTLWALAHEAWQNQSKGHVEFIFRLTPRCSELIKAYREQCVEIEKSDATASEVVLKIWERQAAGQMQADEALLRTACVDLKTRGEFFNLYKKMVPLLRIPDEGKSKTLPARDGENRVQKPGYRVISLNASEKMRKEMRL